MDSLFFLLPLTTVIVTVSFTRLISARLLKKLTLENPGSSSTTKLENFIWGSPASTSLSFHFIKLIEEQVNNKDTYQKILPTAEKHMDDFLRRKLPEQMPMIAMFIGDKTINELKALFMRELEILVPEIMQNYFDSIFSDTDMQNNLQKKLHLLAENNLKPLIVQHVKNAIPKITWFAILFGTIAGILQAIIIKLLI